MVEILRLVKTRFVMPAEAGIQVALGSSTRRQLDSGVRRNDEGELSFGGIFRIPRLIAGVV
jgi:hypothetical protein